MLTTRVHLNPLRLPQNKTLKLIDTLYYLILKIRSDKLYTCGKNVFWKEPKVCSPAHTLTHTQTHKHMSIPQPPPINILQPQPSGAPILQPQPARGTILQPQPSENPVTQPQPVASSPQKEEKVTSIHL